MNILLATDGSDSAEAAVGFLQRFPFPKESRVTLLTVIDKDVFEEKDAGSLDEEHRKLLADTAKAVEEEGEQLIAGEVERLRKAGWTGNTEVRVGHPAHEILQAAESHQVDLIVVGSKGMTGVKRYLLGSVARRVLHHAKCSVLVVRKPEGATAEAFPSDKCERCRVLLAYDNSAPAKRAVELCASLPVGEKAEITAVTVLPLVTLYRQDISQRLSNFWRQKKKAAEAALDWVSKEVKWTAPHVKTELRESADVSHEILDMASERNIDLIMLGDKGKSPVEQFLIGTVTRRIAKHAPCSVWVVKN